MQSHPQANYVRSSRSGCPGQYRGRAVGVAVAPDVGVTGTKRTIGVGFSWLTAKRASQVKQTS